MIRRKFLSTAERKELLSLARDGSAAHRIARRANAILLLDDGLSCERVAKVLYLDDDTVRGWRKLYEERGIAGLEEFDAGGSSSRLSTEQEEALKAHVAQSLPRGTRLALTRPCCSWTRCIQLMPHGRLAAGCPRKKIWQSSRPAGASVSIFTARLTLRPGKPA